MIMFFVEANSLIKIINEINYYYYYWKKKCDPVSWLGHSYNIIVFEKNDFK